MVNVFKALSDEHRLRLMNLLLVRKLCVCDIEAILEMSQSNVSRHLQKLKSAGMIDSEKRAQWVYYSLNSSFIDENENLILYLNHQFGQSSVYKNDRDKLETYKQVDLACGVYMEGLV
jgi:ArsR family transcriptional regulator